MKKEIIKKYKKKSLTTLGPLFFNWSPEKVRDFYFRIADESVVDVVYLGEVVCSKRQPFLEDDYPEIISRLQAGGKEIVISTLALVTSDRELNVIESNANSGYQIEANDVACLQALAGRPHIVGPFINVFNKSTRDFMIRNNAQRIVLPVEMNASGIDIVTEKGKVIDTEVMVFGRQPLSVAMRCYHARSHGVNKDSCQFVCGLDPDGLAAETLDGQSILTVNGTQTMSHGYVVLLHELNQLQAMGVSHFRLSPQDVDMVEVSRLYRAVLDKKIDPDEAISQLRTMTAFVPYINGFMHAQEGMSWSENRV